LIELVAATIELRPAAEEVDHAEIARKLAPVLRALADENRLAIVLAIAERARSVKDLTEAVGLSQTLVSHHLRALRGAGLVSVTAKGRSNVYSMCCGALADPVRLLAEMAAGAPENPYCA
jgi:DNA-binding transcriptional ArsR family regulator